MKVEIVAQLHFQQQQCRSRFFLFSISKNRIYAPTININLYNTDITENFYFRLINGFNNQLQICHFPVISSSAANKALLLRINPPDSMPMIIVHFPRRHTNSVLCLSKGNSSNAKCLAPSSSRSAGSQEVDRSATLNTDLRLTVGTNLNLHQSAWSIIKTG